MTGEGKKEAAGYKGRGSREDEVERMPVKANCIKRTQGRKELCLNVEVKVLTVARRKREAWGEVFMLRDNQPLGVGGGGVVTGRMWHNQLLPIWSLWLCSGEEIRRSKLNV